MRRFARAGVCIPLVGALVLQSCITIPITEANDICAPLRAPIEDVVKGYNNRFLVSVAGSAAAGAAAGGVIAKETDTNILKGMALGALAGVVAGSIFSYYKNSAEKAKNNQALQSAINADITAATGDVRKVSAAVTKLNQCRLDQLAGLRSRVDGGAAGDAEAVELKAIRRRMTADRRLINGAIGEVNTGNDIFKDAFAQSHQIDEARVATRAASYSPQIVAASVSRSPVPVETPTEGEPAFASADVNVRSGPDSSNDKLGTLLRGQSIGVISGELGSGWVKVNYKGQTGYVAGRYLSATRPSASGGNLPTVERSSRPKGANSADELLIEARDLRASSEAQTAYLDNTLSEIDSLLKL